jgi:hypothetical protein
MTPRRRATTLGAIAAAVVVASGCSETGGINDSCIGPGWGKTSLRGRDTSVFAVGDTITVSVYPVPCLAPPTRAYAWGVATPAKLALLNQADRTATFVATDTGTGVAIAAMPQSPSYGIRVGMLILSRR